MTLIVEDKARNLNKLLHTIHRDVIEAIILGIVGWKASIDEEFAKHLLPLDNCAGTYLVTFLIRNRQAGLTGEETRRLKEVATRYAKGYGRKVNANSSPEHQEAAEEAANIEFCIDKTGDREAVLKDCRNGKRRFHYKQIQVFCNQLGLRIAEDMDVSVCNYHSKR